MPTIPFTPPKISESINRLTYDWHDMSLLVIADRITDEGFAELWFYHNNGNGKSLLHTAKANLLSTTTMNQVCKRMGEHSQDIPWQQVMTCIASQTMEYQRRGEPPVVIEPHPGEIEPPFYFVEPLIMKGVPSVIYGDKGVNKTTIGLAALGLIYCGDFQSTWGLTANKEAKIGLLDWESSKDITLYTASRLIEGGTVSYFQLPYLRCKQTLSDDIQRISNFISDYQIEVLLIDSLGQAAGSDKFDSSGKAAALKFFECLRMLNVSSLIIAQNSKGAETNQKTIYGSTYFTYYARNIFELRKSKGANADNSMSVALFHQESNYSKKYDPIGFNIAYTDQTIKITHEEVNLASFVEKVNQSKIVLDLLRTGSQNVKAIANVLKTSVNTTGVILNRLQEKGYVTKLGSGMWGLATKNDEDLEEEDVT